NEGVESCKLHRNVVTPDGQSRNAITSVLARQCCAHSACVGITYCDGNAGQYRATRVFDDSENCSRRKLQRGSAGGDQKQNQQRHNALVTTPSPKAEFIAHTFFLVWIFVADHESQRKSR